ncbi:SMEK domain-containing protein [Chitinophaga sp.]|uniref:SMEK domain-containing protein n=1 Tax=Chitinophaga sp. TaxID=1869181 RepID=UPI0031DEF0B5
MFQRKLLESINFYFSTFSAQVKTANANNEYDINIHAENVIIPILNTIFGYNLKNANYTDQKNVKAIDLVDIEKKVAFQVTSTNNIEKIKNTLEKFINSDYINKIDKLYIYILTEKKKPGLRSELAIENIVQGKLDFCIQDNVLDATDMYVILNQKNDLETLIRVEKQLHLQFGKGENKDRTFYNRLSNFIEKYKESCINNFSRINFFGLAITKRPREVELYDLFVAPNFRLSGLYGQNLHELLFDDENLAAIRKKIIKSKKKHPKEIKELKEIKRLYDLYYKLLRSKSVKTGRMEFDKFFLSSKHIAVIGNPGAGKSLMIKYAICKILEKDSNVFSSAEIFNYTPFRIELHKYNKTKKSGSYNILTYLKKNLSEEYQIEDITIDDLAQIFSKYKTLVFFDGLDEIFDVHERIDIRNDIEIFTKQYENSRTVVTSRFESYEEVKLNEKIYHTYEILDFDDDQVKDYVNNWYTLEETNRSKRNFEIKNCLEQLNSVDDEIKYNPLLLSLIIILYRNQLEIPASKLEIYESCTNTIVDQRDEREKKLEIKTAVGNRIAIFSNLAYWLFKNESEGKNHVNYDNVKEFTKNYLLNKGEFQEENIAEKASKEFLEFAKVRSIFHENKFTHKTFLEYFTAFYIYSSIYNKSKKEDLTNLIKNYIGSSSWSIVLELLICKIDNNQLDFEIVDEIISTQIQLKELDAIIFFLQILKHLKNISPKKTTDLIKQAIEYCLKMNDGSSEYKPDYQEIIINQLHSLAQYSKYEQYLLNSFKEVALKPGIDLVCLNVFAYEFSILSNSDIFIQAITETNKSIETDYIFLLRNYARLQNETTYLDTLKLFIKQYGVDKTEHIYSSYFNLPIFKTDTKFNWNIYYIFTGPLDSNKIYEKYKTLISVGISQSSLQNSAKAISVSSDPILYGLLGPIKTENIYFNKFIITLRKIHGTDKFYENISMPLEIKNYISKILLK